MSCRSIHPRFRPLHLRMNVTAHGSPFCAALRSAASAMSRTVSSIVWHTSVRYFDRLILCVIAETVTPSCLATRVRNPPALRSISANCSSVTSIFFPWCVTSEASWLVGFGCFTSRPPGLGGGGGGGFSSAFTASRFSAIFLSFVISSMSRLPLHVYD